MTSRILIKPIEVRNRLAEIGFTVEELLEVVAAMVAARNSCTENNPASAPGWMAWSEGCRRLREVGIPKGWRRDETGQIPSIVDEGRGLRLTVCNTDDGTCREGRTPQNRTKKGPATDRIADGNQGWLFDPTEAPKVSPFARSKRQPGATAVYYLCVYHEGDDVRAELSCPSEVDAGFFSDFVEQIYLLGDDGGPGDGGVARRDEPPGDGGEFEIPVTRKA